MDFPDHLDSDVLDVLQEDAVVGLPGQLQPIEAGVALQVGVHLVVGGLLDVELLVLSSVALQVLEPQQRHVSIANHEVQHLRQSLLVELLDVLPEPEDHLVARSEARVSPSGR
jgi:hypothetical protein